ncbi:hypothetical protein L1887_51907 [Cichorium endivia]|nr:hypothetical protein L1887_51907 [Cichorium endivia]
MTTLTSPAALLLAHISPLGDEVRTAPQLSRLEPRQACVRGIDVRINDLLHALVPVLEVDGGTRRVELTLTGDNQDSVSPGWVRGIEPEDRSFPACGAPLFAQSATPTAFRVFHAPSASARLAKFTGIRPTDMRRRLCLGEAVCIEPTRTQLETSTEPSEYRSDRTDGPVLRYRLARSPTQTGSAAQVQASHSVQLDLVVRGGLVK